MPKSETPYSRKRRHERDWARANLKEASDLAEDETRQTTLGEQKE